MRHPKGSTMQVTLHYCAEAVKLQAGMSRLTCASGRSLCRES